jgi:hypothetical protein
VMDDRQLCQNWDRGANGMEVVTGGRSARSD